MTTSSDISLAKVSDYLNGQIDVGNQSEVDKLNNLLINHKKAGNAFLHMAIYRIIKRLSRQMDLADTIEEKLYQESRLTDMNTEQLMKAADSLNKSIDTMLRQIQEICNKNVINSSVVNNILFNYTDPGVSQGENIFDKTQRDKLREGVTQLLISINENQGTNTNGVDGKSNS